MADNASVDNTAQHFCALEIAGNCDGAYTLGVYTLLSSRTQQQVSIDQFDSASQKAHLTACEPACTGPAFTVLSDATILQMRYSISAGPSDSLNDTNGAMRLIRATSGWQVDVLTSRLFSLP
ncbi:MAG: hypothetical protein ABI068_17540 [Ktedonobacterales bacterium]